MESSLCVDANTRQHRQFATHPWSRRNHQPRLRGV